ncbi:mlr5935 [Mesorhizobium japonicum MAFF 303099]|uniref:Mlr5935 protein n=2 Tax=Mesorhizobium japonicum TaxID=2066070 RepID=Q98AM4_RHILO|nr:mlr5935 [Mesorhizobium japonicum MAFF 303099]
MHRDGFTPALDAARILHDGNRLLDSTAHEIDLAELSARLSSGGRADQSRQTSTLSCDDRHQGGARIHWTHGHARSNALSRNPLIGPR